MHGIIAGADVGGTMLKLALFTEEGTLLRKWSVKSPSRDEIGNLFSLIGGEFREKAEKLRNDHGPLLAAGINLPGEHSPPDPAPGFPAAYILQHRKRRCRPAPSPDSAPEPQAGRHPYTR